MADGSRKNIEDIKVGDWVWAHDPETGEEGPRQVTDVIVGEGEKQLVEITDQDGDVVTATADHPFWEVTRGEWLDAGELQVGDVLMTQDGRLLTVAALHSYTVYETVYNLTVDGLHTYYVFFGSDAVLVHNCGRSTLPRAANGDYLPDPAAVGRPHTVIGERVRPTGPEPPYRQGATFDADGRFTGRTDVTDHGRFDHPNPHFHPATSPNSVGPPQPIPGVT